MPDTLRDKLIQKGWVTEFHVDTLVSLIEEHYAALAALKPEVPTDEAIKDLAQYDCKFDCFDTTTDDGQDGVSWECWDCELLDFARAVLDRWGNHRGILGSSPQPIPVSERLPGPDDCDAEGRCWWIHSTKWSLLHERQARALSYTYWLPAHALPLPSGEVE